MAAGLLLATSCGVALPGEPRPEPGATATLPGPGGGTAPDGGSAAPSVADLPLAGRVVLIDPGHNGGNVDASDEINRQVPAGPETKACDTVGASTDDGYPEHEFNWDLSLRVRDYLTAEGAEVVLTREDDESVGPCVNERAEIGNEADADAAVSIHADGASAGVRGFHVIAPGEVTGFTEPILESSYLLAEDLRDEFHEVTGQPYSDYLGEEGIDVRTDLGGLNMSTVPKVFLEVGNMRNPSDAENLTDPEWRDLAAEGIAAGLSRYLERD
ncbi:N-acetylmuramoyl-L-alanine amidase [Actinorugispora endophytica]|uniref:N-acetylmuramoyl-L-alanine amidase n=1 Tax=Actinorugispora endophytica TaxID=1605990 RepID=A0A4R6V766_9ACTN|nr:N-acetylmuramoyl-L-alanine amidase [Actinorugispora endophytica]